MKVKAVCLFVKGRADGGGGGLINGKKLNMKYKSLGKKMIEIVYV